MKTALIALLVGTIAWAGVAAPTRGHAVQGRSQELQVTASLQPYDSICGWPDDIAALPDSMEVERAGTVGITGCRDLQEQYGHPPAVKLTFRNASKSEAAFLFGGIGGVGLTGKDGVAHAPIAVHWRALMSLPGMRPQMVPGFATQLSGAWRIYVAAGASMDIFCLFEHAAVGDAVRAGEFVARIR